LSGLVTADRAAIGSAGFSRALVARKGSDRSDDHAGQRHEHNEKLRQPEQQTHSTRMPPESQCSAAEIPLSEIGRKHVVHVHMGVADQWTRARRGVDRTLI